MNGKVTHFSIDKLKPHRPEEAHHGQVGDHELESEAYDRDDTR